MDLHELLASYARELSAPAGDSAPLALWRVFVDQAARRVDAELTLTPIEDFLLLA